MYDVSLVPCGDYEPSRVRSALLTALDAIDGLAWVRPGIRVALKANLVTAMRPESTAVTHPVVVAEITRLLTERGARVIVGDSPGGPFHAAYLAGVYAASGMKLAQDAGAELNHDCRIGHVDCPEYPTLRKFDYAMWLRDCDVIVDVCKLKSHGLTGISGAVKNLFGTIPGLAKTEYHYLHADHDEFARMLVELCEYWHPVLSVCDAVEAMEGNGPTQGTPRHVGVLAASLSPHKLDLALADLVGLQPEQVPTLSAAIAHGLLPETAEELSLYGDMDALRVSGFRTVATFTSLLLRDGNTNVLRRTTARAVEAILRPRPWLGAGCVGCGHCASICPAKAIAMRERRPVIDRNLCIRCFCCQEFCPVGAMKVRRSALARILLPKQR